MRILIAVDGSNYSRAAIDFIAKRETLIKSDPVIQVLNVQWLLPVSPVRIAGKPMVHEYYEDEAEQALAPARRRLQKAGLSPTVRFTTGRPATEIAAAADEDKVDLLVLGSHGHSALGGMLLGSVSNEVLVRTERATLIVRGKTKKYSDSLRVGIAVDGSAYGPAALKYVLSHLELFGATPSLSLIHVVPIYDLIGVTSGAEIALPAPSAEEIRALHDKAFEGALRPVRRLLKNAPVTAAEVRLSGHVGDELSAYAEKKLDVLVMGSHGYGAFKAAVLGSVANRVNARGSIPLLFIRSTGTSRQTTSSRSFRSHRPRRVQSTRG